MFLILMCYSVMIVVFYVRVLLIWCPQRRQLVKASQPIAARTVSHPGLVHTIHSCTCIVLLCTGGGRGGGRGGSGGGGRGQGGKRNIQFSFILFMCLPICSRYRTIPKWRGSSCSSFITASTSLLSLNSADGAFGDRQAAQCFGNLFSSLRDW